MRLFISKQ